MSTQETQEISEQSATTLSVAEIKQSDNKTSSSSKKRKSSSTKSTSSSSSSSKVKKQKVEVDEQEIELPEVELSDDETYVNDEQDKGILLKSKAENDKYLGDIEYIVKQKPSKEEIDKKVQSIVETLKEKGEILDQEKIDLIKAAEKRSIDVEYKEDDSSSSDSEEEEEVEEVKAGSEVESDGESDDEGNEEEQPQEKKETSNQSELHHDDLEIAKSGKFTTSPIQTRSQRRQKLLMELSGSRKLEQEPLKPNVDTHKDLEDTDEEDEDYEPESESQKE